MAERLSTSLRNGLANQFAKLMENGCLDIYSGTQPTDADTAESGTKLVSLTSAAGTLTQEVRATGTITISGTSGTITHIAVGGVTTTGVEILGATVTWASSNTATAALVAAQINTYNFMGITATSDGAVVTLTAPWGAGNVSWDITSTCSGGDMAAADVNFSGGTTPVNGLALGNAAAGVIGLSGTWSGVIVASGTAGWARLYNSDYVTGASTTALRMDFSVASSGADINLSSTALTLGATLTISTFNVTQPAS